MACALRERCSDRAELHRQCGRALLACRVLSPLNQASPAHGEHLTIVHGRIVYPLPEHNQQG